ncbi:hypothetical protein BgiMline_027795, partial [Biomphalaria glabrata]
AQEDAQILKSVVVPLENEIKTLKAKLKETELKLAESHKKNQSASERDRKSPTLPDLDSITDLNEK